MAEAQVARKGCSLPCPYLEIENSALILIIVIVVIIIIIIIIDNLYQFSL